MILQFEFLILDEMRDTLDHDHFVGAVLIQDFLTFKSNYLLVVLTCSSGSPPAVVSSIIQYAVLRNAERKTLRRY
jgi:hypothetical protein